MFARPAAGAVAAALFLVVLAPGSLGARPRPDFQVAPASVGVEATAGRSVYRALASPGRVPVVVALRNGGLPSSRRLPSRRERVATVQHRVLARLSHAGFRLTARWRATPAFAGTVTRRGLAALLASPDVLRVDLDRRVHASLAQSVALIRADQAQAAGRTGNGVTVAVLDTGIDADHPDLASSVAGEQCFTHNAGGGGGCPNGLTVQSGPGAAADDEGHGTGVAGIITADGVASSKGVAPNAKIVAVKVLAADGGGSLGDIVSGLDWVINNRPDVKVVNMSLGSSELSSTACDGATAGTIAEASVLHALRARGVTVFVASGNDASGSQVGEPACIDGVVSVGAVYDANVGGVNFDTCADSTTAADKVLCISDGGAQLDVLAPGGRITAPKNGGGTEAGFGTSDAAPHAAGVAALMLEARPSLTPEQIETTMKQTGVPVVDPRSGMTFPRIDALAALAAVPGLPAPPPPPTYLPAGSTTFGDAGGDAAAGPDLASVAVTTAANGIATVAVQTPNRSTLATGETLWVIFDVDRNPATGNPRGGELAVVGTDDGFADLVRWTGAWSYVRSLADASYAGGVFTFKISEDELGARSDFRLIVVGQTASTVADLSPSTDAWPYPAVPLVVTRSGTGTGSVTGGGANGIACGGVCTALFGRGAGVTLAATPAAGSVFMEWSGACSGAACALALNDAQAVGARFELLRRVTVASVGTGSGSVSSGPAGIACGATCAASFPNGTTVTLTPQAAAGSRFDGWSGACAGTEPCALGIDADRTVTATFADIAAPTARALASVGRRGGTAKLKYRVQDNTDAVRVELTVFRGRRKAATLRGQSKANGALESRSWRVPRRFRGAGRLCVRATDPAGNRSAQSCAAFRVR